MRKTGIYKPFTGHTNEQKKSKLAWGEETSSKQNSDSFVGIFLVF